jgi:hypothetical protein
MKTKMENLKETIELKKDPIFFLKCVFFGRQRECHGKIWQKGVRRALAHAYQRDRGNLIGMSPPGGITK